MSTFHRTQVEDKTPEEKGPTEKHKVVSCRRCKIEDSVWKRDGILFEDIVLHNRDICASYALHGQLPCPKLHCQEIWIEKENIKKWQFNIVSNQGQYFDQ